MSRLAKSAPLLAVGALFLFCICIWTTALTAQGQGRGVLTFAMLDIGQGDALYIEGPTGVQVLVDSGLNNGAVLRELPNVMPLADRTLDAVIETHPDADHTGGFVDVLDRYQVGAFITPGVIKQNTITDALAKKVAKLRIPIYVARRGMVLDLGGGARFVVLYPDQDVSGWEKKSNDGSIVAHLVYGKTSALLTGDSSSATERYLISISTSTDLQSDILKVGHHGSKSSTGYEFIAAVDPQIALISAGAKNSYGHPTQEVLSRIQESGAEILRTDQKGTVVCTSDGATFSCE